MNDDTHVMSPPTQRIMNLLNQSGMENAGCWLFLKESHTYNSHSQNRKTRDTISPDTASIYTHRWQKLTVGLSLGCVGTELRYKHT